jgi:hypothetical protein
MRPHVHVGGAKFFGRAVVGSAAACPRALDPPRTFSQRSHPPATARPTSVHPVDRLLINADESRISRKVLEACVETGSTLAAKMRTATVTEPSAARAANAEPRRQLRSVRTNNPFAGGLSKNTSAGRRVADLLRSFLRAMGDPSDAVLQSNALRAAELTVAAETARAKLLAGDGEIDAVVRIEGMAARSVRGLGIKSTTSAPTAMPLREQLAREAAEAAEREGVDD